ncbi:MAG: DUF6268 family outer membrane beta-barrel protein [Puniceicoccaceae bacterium]
MKKFLLLLIVAATTTALRAGPDSREGTGQPPGSGWTADLSTFHSGSADLDSGGDFTIASFRFKTGYSWTSSTQSRSSVELYLDWRDYNFDGLFDPWSTVFETGLSYAYNHDFGNDWSLMLTPSIRFSLEDGADLGDSLQAGGIFAFTREISPALRLGIGAGVFTGLEDTSAFPFLLIRWQIDENWYIGNPFAPGPVGPAGLELGYRYNSQWTFAVGGAYRSDRFALGDDGLWADGYGEVEGTPVFFRATYNAGSGSRVHLYVGTILSGELQIDDTKGRKWFATDYDPSLLLALAWQGRF